VNPDQLTRGLQATEQALLDERAAHRNDAIVATAARALCRAVLAYDLDAVERGQDALMAACQATTPSPNPMYVVAKADDLERLQAENARLLELLDQESGAS
jgi:hypothetical protein